FTKAFDSNIRLLPTWNFREHRPCSVIADVIGFSAGDVVPAFGNTVTHDEAFVDENPVLLIRIQIDPRLVLLLSIVQRMTFINLIGWQRNTKPVENGWQ